MNPDPDPLWYDREEPDGPMELSSLVMSIGLVSLAGLFFMLEGLWSDIKLATVLAFRDIEDTHR